MKRDQETCRCSAYKFPHRRGSKACSEQELKRLQENRSNRPHDPMYESGHSNKDFV
jgi:hypothetical protein